MQCPKCGAHFAASAKRRAEVARRPRIDWSLVDRCHEKRSDYVTRAQVRTLARFRRRAGYNGARFEMWCEGGFGALMITPYSADGRSMGFCMGIERDGYGPHS